VPPPPGAENRQPCYYNNRINLGGSAGLVWNMLLFNTGEDPMSSVARTKKAGGAEDSARPAIVPNEVKLRELMLYVCIKCGNDKRFGSVKLNKLLYFSDFYAYAYLGAPITGVEYFKLPNGPAPRRLIPIRDEMTAKGELGMQHVKLSPGYIQKRPVALRDPDLSVFSAKEIALVDDVINVFCNDNAREISDASHRMMGWRAARDNETIPYETVFVSNEPLTPLEQIRGAEIAARFRLAPA
jgi:hypothetical protein